MTLTDKSQYKKRLLPILDQYRNYTYTEPILYPNYADIIYLGYVYAVPILSRSYNIIKARISPTYTNRLGIIFILELTLRLYSYKL